MKQINVLLTGGIGSRLWPLSRKSRPKQYIPLFDGKTLFSAGGLTPADHIIEDLDAYKSCVQRAVELAAAGHLVTFGIQPAKPETGYGYINNNGEDVISFKKN